MPRPPRKIQADCPYHCMNRSNFRREIFRKDDDYRAFLGILAEGLKRYPVDLFAYCLMPNHWHLLLSPREADALAGFMRWVGVTHVRRYYAHYHTAGGGHLYQGRFKSFPVQPGHYFRSVACYVESNARRAKLVKRAQDWKWGSAYAGRHEGLDLKLSKWPTARPKDWVEQLNEPWEAKELKAMRSRAARGTPLGEAEWVDRTARAQGLESTLRPRGRPRTEKEK